MDKPDLSNWDDYSGEFLKAVIIKEFPAILVCTGVEGFNQDGKNRLVADVEYKQRKWKFDLNKTNQNFLKTKIKSPRELVGLKLTCEKIKTRNPTTNSMVDSLIITDVE